LDNDGGAIDGMLIALDTTTLLADLNVTLNPAIAEDLAISLSDGSPSTMIDLDPTLVLTLGDFEAAVEAASNVDVVIGVGAIDVVDNTFVDPPLATFSITDLNDSGVASMLGIAGTDGFSDPTEDGTLEGALISFLEELAAFDVSPQLDEPGGSNRLFAVVDANADPLAPSQLLEIIRNPDGSLVGTSSSGLTGSTEVGPDESGEEPEISEVPLFYEAMPGDEPVTSGSGEEGGGIHEPHASPTTGWGGGSPVTLTYSYVNMLDGGIIGLGLDEIRAGVEEGLGLWASV
ncbi:MAG: hypothetical protein QF735_13905, partial [Phycisphaeraceae bacterium]|nr:hypothetical protein [Phycisphaeraceae bacterium]